jgi:hypothetical protein
MPEELSTKGAYFHTVTRGAGRMGTSTERQSREAPLFDDVSRRMAAFQTFLSAHGPKGRDVVVKRQACYCGLGRVSLCKIRKSQNDTHVILR